MVLEFKLPDIGEGVAEGEIVQWLVNAGDEVAEFQPVVEVMTDKATVEIPAPAAGTIGELRAAPGDVVPVGTVIFTLESGGAPAAPAAESAPPAAAAPAEEADAGAAESMEEEEFTYDPIDTSKLDNSWWQQYSAGS